MRKSIENVLRQENTAHIPDEGLTLKGIDKYLLLFCSETMVLRET